MRKYKHDKSDNCCGVLFEPNSTWTVPQEFPCLSGVKSLGIDLESRDPNLLSRGPGFIRGDAEVVGVSIATLDRGWYFPIRHLGGGNLDPGSVSRYLRDLLSNYSGWLIGAGLPYDLEGLWSLGVEISPKAKLCDVQLAEALICEEREDDYTLETLCKCYLGEGKDESGLNEAAKAYGVDPKGGLWKLPAKHVGPYAERDAIAPLKIFREQLKILQKEDLTQIFELESKLLPLLWKMRLQGIPVDLERAKLLSDKLLHQEEALRSSFKATYGCILDEWSGPQLASLCDRNKIHYPRTPKGNPSFEGAFLDASDVPLLKAVSSVRELNRLRSTFIDDWIFKNEISGIIHPQWKQLKRDDGGTRTGRMAASNPNPQQVPARADLAPLVRELFIPSKPKKWAKIDYSQQEPRILVHYASLCKLSGAELIRLAYNENKSMDIYQFLGEAAKISRREAKDLTLGRCYGMGIMKLSMKLGISQEAAKKVLDSFDSYVPFVKEIADLAMNNAQRRGFIKTICGRKRHFNYWEPIDAFQQKRDGHNCMPLERAAAEKRWPNIKLQRAHTHKAMNSLIQGSAADMTKSALLAIYEETGLIPYMQVHDELDYGVEDEKQAKQIQEIAENCVKMQVPIKADLSFGDHWK